MKFLTFQTLTASVVVANLAATTLTASAVVANLTATTRIAPLTFAPRRELLPLTTTTSNFRIALLDVVSQEWNFWDNQLIKERRLIKRGKRETQDKYWQRVGDYWRSIGLRYTGRDTDQAWSAAFISWSMKEAGAGSNFKYSRRHSTYITDAIANRKADSLDAPFVGYKVDEYAPQEGDLVCYGRASWVNYNTTGKYPSHCDVVVDTNPDNIEVIGGNVANSVSKKILKVDPEGQIADQGHQWFVVLKNNL